MECFRQSVNPTVAAIYSGGLHDARRTGRLHGREFAVLAVDLRLKGLSPERWGEFMRHRMAALALDLSSDDERRRWGDACMRSYCDALEDTDALVLEVSPAQGRG
jgi:hypothetical protein